MKRDSRFHIAVVPGDGIGPEIVGACLQVLDVLHERLGGIGFDFRHLDGGAAHYQKTGVAFSDESMAECKKADAVLFGAIGLPEVRYPDGTEISTQFDLRAEMDLYAGLRPIRSYPGLPLVLGVPLLFGVLRKELSLLMIYQALGTKEIGSLLDSVQIVTLLLFLTFYIPCVSTFAVMLKTIGRREALFSVSVSVGAALLIAGILRLGLSGAQVLTG